VRLGVGVIAIGAGVTYILTGVVNWRDYQEKVDWGVVWLYAGAILFGKLLDSSGAAYLIARSIVSGLSHVGLDQGLGLLATAGVITGGITNLMADGPAAAAVGPVTLNMAGMVHPGTAMVPFMAMATACASSFAYALIIGTPPNAIVYASGHLTPRDFLKAGIPLWIIANIVMLLMITFYWMPRGFAGLPGI
jgi:solute carrier family 13 (sodium-dependent dicarboxylate transporter), member 2/3/5